MQHKLSKQKHKDFSRKQKRQSNTQVPSIKDVFNHNLGHSITLLFILGGIGVMSFLGMSVTDVAYHSIVIGSVVKFLLG